MGWVVGITAWQSYRFLTGALFSRIQCEETTSPATLKPGNFLPGWVVPFTGDFCMGLVSPLMCFALAMRPSLTVWGLACAYHGIGV